MSSRLFFPSPVPRLPAGIVACLLPPWKKPGLPWVWTFYGYIHVLMIDVGHAVDISADIMLTHLLIRLTNHYGYTLELSICLSGCRSYSYSPSPSAVQVSGTRFLPHQEHSFCSGFSQCSKDLFVFGNHLDTVMHYRSH